MSQEKYERFIKITMIILIFGILMARLVYLERKISTPRFQDIDSGYPNPPVPLER